LRFTSVQRSLFNVAFHILHGTFHELRQINRFACIQKETPYDCGYFHERENYEKRDEGISLIDLFIPPIHHAHRFTSYRTSYDNAHVIVRD